MEFGSYATLTDITGNVVLRDLMIISLYEHRPDKITGGFLIPRSATGNVDPKKDYRLLLEDEQYADIEVTRVGKFMYRRDTDVVAFSIHDGIHRQARTKAVPSSKTPPVELHRLF